MRRSLTFALLTLLVAESVSPATVAAPTFDELISRAESVFVGEVVDVRSAWLNSRSGRAIVTDVTFSIERTLKGPSSVRRTLEFLGGTVGDHTLRVTGIPEFKVGDRDVLFVSDSGRPMSPLVGVMFGRFRIFQDPRTGGAAVRTFDGRPLATLAEVGSQDPPSVVTPQRTLSLDQVLGAIDGKVRALARR